MIDAHSHVLPNVNGHVGDGPTRGIGHGRIKIGDTIISVMPDYGDTTCFTAAMSVAELDAAGIEQTVLLQGPFWGECNDFAAAAVQAGSTAVVAQEGRGVELADLGVPVVESPNSRRALASIAGAPGALIINSGVALGMTVVISLRWMGLWRYRD